MIGPELFAVAKEGCRVGQSSGYRVVERGLMIWFDSVDEPHDDEHRSGRRGKSRHNVQVPVDEGLSQEEIFWRVTGGREFRQHQHVGPSVGSPRHGVEHPLEIPVEISHDEIELSSSNSKTWRAAHVPSNVSAMRKSTTA